MGTAVKNKKKTGRPRIEISDNMLAEIISMIEISCTQEEICHVLKISADTLNRRLKERGVGSFAELYKKHEATGKASLRRMQWHACAKGSVPMLIWLGKQLLGQKENPENAGQKHEPLEITITVSKPAQDEVPPEYLSGEGAD